MMNVLPVEYERVVLKNPRRNNRNNKGIATRTPTRFKQTHKTPYPSLIDFPIQSFAWNPNSTTPSKCPKKTLFHKIFCLYNNNNNKETFRMGWIWYT